MDQEPTNNKYGKLLPIFLFGLLIIGGIYALTVSRNKGDKTSQTNDSMMQGMDHGSMAPTDQSHRGYNLKLTSSPDNIQPGQSTKVSYKVVNDKGEVLKDYTVAHDKIMHFIVVRKDLQYFQHLHPEFNQSTGEFSINMTFPTDGTYRIFPDFTPTPENPQKLTVTLNQDLNVGDLNKYKAQAALVDTDILKLVDGYRIDYNFPAEIKAGEEVSYSLIVEKENEDITIEPYLGAMGHGVVLRDGNLDFIHTHAAGMDGMGGMQGMDHKMSGGVIEFSTTFPEAGIYKIFTQFQVKGKVITSDYTINVK